MTQLSSCRMPLGLLILGLCLFSGSQLLGQERLGQERLGQESPTDGMLPQASSTESSSSNSPALDSSSRGEPILLFDGTSLEGWGNKDGSPNKGWVIQEGVLVRSQRAGHLYYSGQFENFELTFDWKQEEGGNSGIKYRVMDYRTLFGTRTLGCEYQCIANEKVSKTSTASLYALYAPQPERKLNPAGQWNSGKVVVNGHNIEHWLNGDLVVTAQVGSPDWLQRVADSKFSYYKQFGQNRSGRIFLQDHGDPVWFRNIVLTPLIVPEQPNQPESVTPAPIETTKPQPIENTNSSSSEPK